MKSLPLACLSFAGGKWLPVAGFTIAAILTIQLSGASITWLGVFPDNAVLPVALHITDAMKYLVNELTIAGVPFSDISRAMASAIEKPMLLIQGVLATGFEFYGEEGQFTRIPPLPWPAILVLFASFAYWTAGARIAALVTATFLYFATFGLWEPAMMTLSSVLVAVAVCFVCGVSLGVLGFLNPRANRILMPLYDVMQTIPTFSYLVPVLLFFGFNPVAALIATVIYAMPPMARVTTLALQRVPENISDFGDMAGCSGRQKMLTVLLPASRHHLLIGINQIIMLSLGMVIIASMIGAGGLGANVFHGLKKLRIGDAVEAGLAITLMAIMLDRVSLAIAAYRPKHHYELENTWWRRQPLLAGTLVAAGILTAASYFIPSLATYPEWATISTGTFWNDLIKWISNSYYTEIGAFRDWLITYVMRPTKSFLVSVPWSAVVIISSGIGYLLGGRKLALTVIGLLTFIVITGYWPQAMVSLYLVSLSVVIAFLVGLPIGLVAGLNDRVDRAVTVAIDTLQTLPAFVYLIPVVMLFSVGEFAGLVAIVLYALPPGIRYTKQGIRQISKSILDASYMAGCTPRQRLFAVQVPLALPDIMLGINQTVMMAFSMLVITALVGTRGLEHETLVAISKVKPGEGIIAGLGISFLSIIVDRLIRAGSIILRRRTGLTGGRDQGIGF